MKKLSPAKVIFLIIGGLFVIAFIIISVKVFVDRPQDLGPELKYVGKQNTGCPLPLPLGYIMLCSSGPSQEYYFETDLTPQDLEAYFKDVDNTLTESRRYPQVEKTFEGQYLEFRKKNTHTFEGFRVTYYDDKNSVTERVGLRQPSKNYLLSITSYGGDYETAKAAIH